MALFQNPEDGTIESIEFYEDGVINDAQLKIVNSKLTCAPFNTPYHFYELPNSLFTANMVAKSIGLKQPAGALIGIPYNPTLPDTITKPQPEETNFNIFSAPATSGLCLWKLPGDHPSKWTSMGSNCAVDPVLGHAAKQTFARLEDTRFLEHNWAGQTIDLGATYTIQLKAGPTGSPTLGMLKPTDLLGKTISYAHLQQGSPSWKGLPSSRWLVAAGVGGSGGCGGSPSAFPPPPCWKIVKEDCIEGMQICFKEEFGIWFDWVVGESTIGLKEHNTAGKDPTPWINIAEGWVARLNASIAENPRSYRDAVFTINKPSDEVAYEASMGDKTGLADPVRVTPHYNYYLQPYEKITRNLMIDSVDSNTKIKLPETMLPNIYGLASDMVVDPSLPNSTYKYADQWQYPFNLLLTLDPEEDVATAVPLQTVNQAYSTIKMLTAPGLTDSNVSFYKEYFNTYAGEMALTNPMFNPQKLIDYHLASKKYYTTGISANDIKDLTKEVDELKSRFPMYVDIEIPAANSGKVGKILKKTNFFNEFMQAAMAAMQPRGDNSEEAMQEFWQETAIVKQDMFSKKTQSEGGVIGGGGPSKAFDPNRPGWKDTLYSESLISLWLNEILHEAGDTFFPNLGGGAAAQDYTYNSVNDGGALKKLNKKIVGNVVRPPIFGREKGAPLQFMNNIKWAQARTKINDLIQKETRSVVDIYAGKKAYSEVLFYEIVKFRYDSETNTKGAFVQNIFLPNIPATSALKYVDTQIKLGEEYYYHIYAHTFVVGTQYEGTDFNVESQGLASDDSPKLAIKCEYTFAPTTYLMRVPYFNTWVTMEGALQFEAAQPTPSLGAQFNSEGTVAPEHLVATDIPIVFNTDNLEFTPIISKPPVFPDTTCLPLYGERNKVLINANFNVGEYEFDPIAIDEEENKHITKLRKNQRKLTGPITFKSDDFCGQIEVLRIDEKPLSYKDFAPTANSRIAILGGSAAFGHVDDTLKPNKDYYYTLREKDIHESYSNPSPVYQVRIVAKEGEAPYTIIDMFFIEEVEEKQPTTRKKLMKYIRIQPSYEQSYLDDSGILAGTPASAEDLIVNSSWLVDHIGDPNIAHPVWGRRFKFRFTSKKTGKKFDLNLKIDNPYAAPEENQSSQGEQNVVIPGKC